MSCVDKLNVQSGAVSGNTNASPVYFARGCVAPPYVAVATLSALGAGTSLVVKLQHSADGTTWFDLGSAFAAQTTTGAKAIDLAVNVLPQIRAVFTFTGGTTTCTSSIDLWYGVGK